MGVYSGDNGEMRVPQDSKERMMEAKYASAKEIAELHVRLYKQVPGSAHLEKSIVGQAYLDLLAKQKGMVLVPEEVTDEMVAEWAERHDIMREISELRELVDDARSLHLIAKAKEE